MNGFHYMDFFYGKWLQTKQLKLPEFKRSNTYFLGKNGEANQLLKCLGFELN